MNHRSSTLSVFVLVAILALGFYLRCQSVLETEVIGPLRADAGQYFLYAYNLRHKHTYSQQGVSTENLNATVKPDAIRSPGYPLFLTLFVDGLPNEKMLNWILFWQALIGTGTILLTYLIFEKLFSPFLALAVALLTALSPHLIVSTSYVLTETLFTFLLVLLGWLMSLFVTKETFWLAILTGALTGVATLVRPSLEFFVLVMALFLLSCYGWKIGTRYAGIIIIGFAVVFLPWIVRNMVTIGNAGDQRLAINFLHHGMYPGFMFEDNPQSYGYPYRFDPEAGEIAGSVSSVLRAISERFANTPYRQAKWYLIDKPRTYYSWDMVQGFGDAFVYPVSSSPYFNNTIFRFTHRCMHILHGPIVILAMMGSLLVWFPLAKLDVDRPSVFVSRFCSLIVFYYTLIHMIGAPFPRYSIPLRPYLYGMAAFALYIFCLSLKRCSQIKKPNTHASPGAEAETINYAQANIVTDKQA